MHRNMLNGLTAGRFMRQHWQKSPLLCRGSLPEFAATLSRNDLIGLAGLPEAESRLILRDGRHWSVRHGPFRRRDFSGLPDRDWTLLVQGVDLLLPRSRQLLDRFNFIPYARLDDLMVSYAPPGGGVGPHFDSYDVFLLQGEGRRRWRISSQRDLTLVKNAPLKILRRFRAEREWVLEAGDLLYLPPRYAHDGVAIDDCITLSIGFRAPSAQDLCARFLDYLQDHLAAEGGYADPDLRATRQPARIPPRLAARLATMLQQLRWDRAAMLEFIGSDLSTPKPHVTFSPPRRPLSRSAFARAFRIGGLGLAPATILLYDDRSFYINGESCRVPAASRTVLRRLADRRSLAPEAPAGDATLDILHDWYRAGYLSPRPRRAAPAP